MQSSFDRALAAVLKSEGGYVDHPKDPGGATNKGITLATFRRLVMPKGTKADLKKLTTEQAAIAYRKGYWATVAGDLLPAGIDYALFDFGVNSGPARAVRELQKRIGADVDGVVGPQTLKAVEAAKQSELIDELCARRLAYVKSLKTWPRSARAGPPASRQCASWRWKWPQGSRLSSRMNRHRPNPKRPPARLLLASRSARPKSGLGVVAAIAAVWLFNAIF